MSHRSVFPIFSPRAKKAVAAAGTSAVVLASAYLIKPWEGLETTAYRDVVGVWTVCYGETKGVKPGDTHTAAECDAMLMERVRTDFYEPLRKCIKGYDKAPVSLQASLLSLAYNVGVPTVCKSTAAARTTGGDYWAACEAATRFNRAGGKVLRGLQLRREYGDANRMGEQEICEAGLNPE